MCFDQYRHVPGINWKHPFSPVAPRAPQYPPDSNSTMDSAILWAKGLIEKTPVFHVSAQGVLLSAPSPQAIVSLLGQVHC